jgi:hypothetical protein
MKSNEAQKGSHAVHLHHEQKHSGKTQAPNAKKQKQKKT